MSEKLSGKISDLPVLDPGSHMPGGEKRIVFGPGRFWDSHVMRCFTLKPEGTAENNVHPWPHWFVCIAGEGKFKIGEEVYDIAAGYWVYVPGDVPHSFWNTGDKELTALCIVPSEGDLDPLSFQGC